MSQLAKMHTLIFDLGGVIIDIDPVGCFERFLSLAPYDAKAALEKGLQHDLLLAYEQGKMSTEQFLNGLQAELKLEAFSEETLIRTWNSMIVGIQPGKIKLLEELRKTHTILILSNTNHLHRLGFDALVQANFGRQELADYANKAYYSYEIGLRKPDAAIYHHVLEDWNLDPDKTLFFDDNEQNIQSARDCGMHVQLVRADTSVESWFIDQGFGIKAFQG